MENNQEKIVYWEERTINIGNYESMKCGITYSSPVKHINNLEKTITIAESEVATIKEDTQDFNETVKLMQSRVRKVLNAREASIRVMTQEYTTDDHPTVDKAYMNGAINDEKLFSLLDQYNSKRDKLKKMKADLALEESVFDNE